MDKHLDHGKIIKGLEKAIEWDRQSRIQRIQEDEATAEHDEHDDGYDIHPDPYCRVCREVGYLDDIPEIDSEDYMGGE